MVGAVQCSDLVSEIYDTVGSADAWLAWLARFAEFLGCSHAALSYGGAHGIGLSAFHGFAPDAIDLYNVYYGSIHPLNEHFTEAVLRGTLPAVWAVETLAPLSTWRRSEFHDDWLRPNDVFHLCGMTLLDGNPLTTGTVHSLVALRPERAAAVSVRELDTMAALRPHLAAVFEMERALGPALVANTHAVELLEALPPILLCRGHAVAFANRRARSLLRQGRPLRVDHGELRACTPAATDALRSASVRASGRRAGGLEPRATSLDVPLDNARRVRLLVAPVPPAVPGPPCDTIILLQDEGGANDPDAVLRRTWRLTRAEADIARHLWAGLEPREIADARGSSLATVRTQIKTLLGKAGAARQTDFIRQMSDLLTSDPAQSRGDAP